MNKIKLYHCELCHNVAWKVHDSGTLLSCCGQEMTELAPGTVDASKEKHVPVIEVNGNTVSVKVGSEPHPMVPEHHIALIALQTADDEVQFATLKAGQEAVATFAVKDPNGSMFAYEWCNLHGLWIAEK